MTNRTVGAPTPRPATSTTGRQPELPPQQDGVTAQQQHTVQRGETAWGIARRFNVALEALVQANGLADPEKLRAGDVLVVPTDTPRGWSAPEAATFLRERSTDGLDAPRRAQRAQPAPSPAQLAALDEQLTVLDGRIEHCRRQLARLERAGSEPVSEALRTAPDVVAFLDKLGAAKAIPDAEAARKVAAGNDVNALAQQLMKAHGLSVEQLLALRGPEALQREQAQYRAELIAFEAARADLEKSAPPEFVFTHRLQYPLKQYLLVPSSELDTNEVRKVVTEGDQRLGKDLVTSIVGGLEADLAQGLAEETDPNRRERFTEVVTLLSRLQRAR